MMWPRIVIVHLLVVILLACPYPCLSQAAAAVGKGTRGHGCGRGCCCPGPASETGKDRPGEPGSRPASGTCLCHGAVTDRPAALPNPDDGFVSLLPPDGMLLTGESFCAEARLLAGQRACHFPLADSGREVRALIASLLL